MVSFFFNFHPDPWGNAPIWRAYFSNGLVQPPTSHVVWKWMTVVPHDVVGVVFFAFTSQDWPALVWGSRLWTRRANSYSSISTYSHVGILEIKGAMLLTCPIALNQSLFHGRNRSQFQAILCLDFWHVCESEGIPFFLPNFYSNVTNVYKVVVV